MRFDDTNPEKEEQEYVDSIIHAVRWLGFDWEDRLFYASDFFEKIYQFSEKLIVDGKAYIDEQTLDQIREGRGTHFDPDVLDDGQGFFAFLQRRHIPHVSS